MQFKQKLSVLFYRKRKKQNANGEIPIYVRITIDGLNDEFSLGIKTLDANWDNKTRRITQRDPDYKNKNKKITSTETALETHFNILQATNSLVKPAELKAAYFTPINGEDLKKQRTENLALSQDIDAFALDYLKYCHKEEKALERKYIFPEQQALLDAEKNKLKETLIQLAKKSSAIFSDKKRIKTVMLTIDEYTINFIQLSFTGQRSYNTVKRMMVRKRRYIEFIAKQYQVTDLPISELELQFANDFYNHQILEYNLSQNTAMKFVQSLKEMLDRAVNNGWTPYNPIKNFKCKFLETDTKYPTMEQIIYLLNFQFDKKILIEIRDVFIFQCFTGYSYLETRKATPEDIFTGHDGKLWISKDRQKTDNEEAVPLLPVALEIINKYKNHPVCIRTGKLLPVHTNETYNRTLKIIASIVEMKILLKTHVARYFFANVVAFNNRVPLKTIGKMLGQKSIRTTEIYVKGNKQNISEEMTLVEKKIFDNKGKLKSIVQKNHSIDESPLRVAHISHNQ